MVAAACVLVLAETASAQQILNLSVGGFVPRGEDARVEGDVLAFNRTFLTFDIGDFKAPIVNGEWLASAGEYFEVGAGLGFYRRTVTSVYTDFIDRDGTEIEQDLRLRLIPISATVRLVPTGTDAAVQPYFGAGLELTNWRYSESGEFIDFNQASRPIFRDTFTKTGTAIGPVALGGIRFNGGMFVVGGEVRYSKAEGDLDETFADDKIDLGGWSYLFTFGLRFD